MEVTRRSFGWHLPKMLQDLSECCCIALDLEFSGIAVRLPGGSPAGNDSQTVQQRYQEFKAAAEDYQVLQIGLTFVEEDIENASYILRPYNLHLNPILDSKLDVERRWSYQSSAVEFLLSNGFRMETPFTDGVLYISRREEVTARRRLHDKEARKATMREITVDQMDENTVQFVNETRCQIDSCISNGELGREGYINIPNPAGSDGGAGSGLADLTLSNYQKRLVHQLVRTEYPGLVSFGRHTFVQILPYNKRREERLQESKFRTFQRRLANQMGFRWIFDAMAGGDISALDPGCFASVIDSPSGANGKEMATEYFEQLQIKLKSRRPVVVGHNLFVDLIYLYRTFVGELPHRVEDFQQEIHELFPLVVDTKYMATQGSGSTKTASSLDEVDKMLQQRKTPTLVTHTDHTKYMSGQTLHEAGYDSLITAQVFLRLSAELHQRVAESKGDLESLQGPGEESSRTWKDGSGKKGSKLTASDESNNMTSSPALDGSVNQNTAIRATPLQPPVNWREPAGGSRIQPIFGHQNKFDLLADQTGDTVPLPVANIATYGPVIDPDTSLLNQPDELAIQQKVDSGELIPRLESEFWRTYGNKLRVFGTAERTCDLAPGVRGDA